MQLSKVYLVLTLFAFLSLPLAAYADLDHPETIHSAIERYGPQAEDRLTNYFRFSPVNYPPESVTFLAIKDEKRLELWADDGNGNKWIRNFAIRAASGLPGPKLLEGDKQVPEGFYKITALNPNSKFHLSMKLNYPNDLDLYHARAEGRHTPGSNIFIHGSRESVGCLALGNAAIEDLFTLVHRVGLENTRVIIAPTDPRKGELTPPVNAPEWVEALYARISAAFQHYRLGKPDL